MRYPLTILATIFLMGCQSLIPTETGGSTQKRQLETNQSETTTDVVREATVNPPDMVITLPSDGSGDSPGTITITQPVQSQQTTRAQTGTAQDANLAMTSETSWFSSIPMGVKLILLAVGLGMLGVVFWLLKRHSLMVSSWVDWADKAFATRTHAYRTKAMVTTDPAIKQEYIQLALDEERAHTQFHKEP